MIFTAFIQNKFRQILLKLDLSSLQSLSHIARRHNEKHKISLHIILRFLVSLIQIHHNDFLSKIASSFFYSL